MGMPVEFVKEGGRWCGRCSVMRKGREGERRR